MLARSKKAEAGTPLPHWSVEAQAQCHQRGEAHDDVKEEVSHLPPQVQDLILEVDKEIERAVRPPQDLRVMGCPIPTPS